jgi:tetratricopeptide (TPR) repeat protein
MIYSYEMDQIADVDRDLFEEHLLTCSFCLGEVQSMHHLSTAMIANREAVLDVLRADGLTFDRVRRRLTETRETLWSRLGEFVRGWPGRSALAGAVAMAILMVFLLRPQPSSNPFRGDLSFDLPAYQNGLQLRGGPQDEATKLFESAMEFYVRGDYASAVSGIQHALRLDSSHPDRWLYLGVSQYALRDSKSAIKSLRQADREGQGLTQIRARWYLAQSYLFEGKVDRARALLESVAAQNGERADDAKLLLARISEHERQRQ